MQAFYMPFGKYKDKPLSQVPKGYLCWVLNNVENLQMELAEAIRAKLAGLPVPKPPIELGAMEDKMARIIRPYE